jgi:CO dehydrogenase/acetyl-CoA synthase delta subunit (corrinoid Fe-S protein)
MAFEIPKIKYTGKIQEVVIGTGQKAVRVGGASCYPFYRFEGEMPNPLRIAFEVWDHRPEDWQEWAIEPYRDVIHDPVAWAKKSIDAYGAGMIALQLKSADPNGMDRPVDEVVRVVQDVVNAIDVPLIIWGTANDDKDADLLRKAAEVCEGKNVAIGPVQKRIISRSELWRSGMARS